MVTTGKCGLGPSPQSLTTSAEDGILEAFRQRMGDASHHIPRAVKQGAAALRKCNHIRQNDSSTNLVSTVKASKVFLDSGHRRSISPPTVGEIALASGCDPSSIHRDLRASWLLRDAED